jgi:hypothetical protein
VAKEEKADGDYEFTPPDFDEEAFIHREMVSFRTTTILFVWGIVAAAMSWGAYLAIGSPKTGWLAGIAIFAATGYALKLIFPRLGADVKHFTRRDWTGTGFLYFFTWLSFFLLAINPPLTDIAAPRIEAAASPPVQVAGMGAAFEVLASDNDRIASQRLVVVRDGRELDAQAQDLGDGRSTVPLSGLEPGTYRLEAVALDGRGHEARAVANLTVQPPGQLLRVTLPREGILDGAARIVVRPDASIPQLAPCTIESAIKGVSCIRHVTLQVQGGGSVGMRNEGQDWTATADHAGWREGLANFTVRAEFLDRFLGANRVPGGELVAGPFTVNVTVPPGQAQHPPLVDQPTARHVSIPGPEIAVVAVAALGAALWARRRQR